MNSEGQIRWLEPDEQPHHDEIPLCKEEAGRLILADPEDRIAYYRERMAASGFGMNAAKLKRAQRAARSWRRAA